MTSAAYTASMINGKKVNELREFFQVEDDLTEEEKMQIDKEMFLFLNPLQLSVEYLLGSL